MQEYSNLMVVGLGVGTVFVGLVALVFICYIMGAVCKLFTKQSKPQQKADMPAKAQTQTANADIQNKQEVLAACCAVIAEEIGMEANNIKVLSFKRV